MFITISLKVNDRDSKLVVAIEINVFGHLMYTGVAKENDRRKRLKCL